MPEVADIVRSASVENETQLSISDQLASVKPFIDEAKTALSDVKRSPFRFARAIKALRIAYHHATGRNPTNGWIGGQLGGDDDELTPQRIGQYLKVADFFATNMDIEMVKGATFKSFEVAIQENEKLILPLNQHQLLKLVQENPTPKVIKAKLNRKPLLVFEAADLDGAYSCRSSARDGNNSIVSLTVAALAVQDSCISYIVQMLKGESHGNPYNADEIRILAEDVAVVIRMVPEPRRTQLLGLLDQHVNAILPPAPEPNLEPEPNPQPEADVAGIDDVGVDVDESAPELADWMKDAIKDAMDNVGAEILVVEVPNTTENEASAPAEADSTDTSSETTSPE